MSVRRRALLAKVGLDGHDVGMLLVARHLSNAGLEVVYLGKRKDPETIVRAAIDEDVDAVGLSCLSGGLADFSVEVTALLGDAGAEIAVFAGGIEEPDEVERMLAAGVRAFFGPGTPLDDVVQAFLTVEVGS